MIKQTSSRSEPNFFIGAVITLLKIDHSTEGVKFHTKNDKINVKPQRTKILLSELSPPSVKLTIQQKEQNFIQKAVK
jgi:hypothetical protein